MVAMRVATFAQSSKMIADAMRVESVMANEQVQESSGVVSTDFGADLDYLATRLYGDEYRCWPARDSRADLSIANDDVAADLSRRATRHPLGAGEPHGLVAIPASGLGA